MCDVNPCRNSAVCVDNDDGTFTCKCQPNYEGILCEKKGKKKFHNSLILIELYIYIGEWNEPKTASRENYVL